MTDNQTNEPTEAQVEAAAQALYEFETGLGEDSWVKAYEVERSLWIYEARAALEAAARAAQGAAPQTERVLDAAGNEAQVKSVWFAGYGGTGVNNQ